MKTISVVMPVYNHHQKFKRSLDSVLNQSYPEVEIIVVDDGSSPSVASVLSDEDKNKIKLIRQQNKGAPAARNKGLENVQGEFVIFFDSDVVAEKDMLKRMKLALDNHPEKSFSYCNYKYGFKKMPAREFSPQKLKQNNYIHTTSLIRTKDVVKWDENLDRFQDWDLWLTLLEQGKEGVWIDEYLFEILSKNDGMSEWLPSFAYHPPFSWVPGIKKKVQDYKQAKRRVEKKHGLV
ncbi:MAG: glycosyltransferase family A protein [Candidatus Paceibacteria bacterium]